MDTRNVALNFGIYGIGISAISCPYIYICFVADEPQDSLWYKRFVAIILSEWKNGDMQSHMSVSTTHENQDNDLNDMVDDEENNVTPTMEDETLSVITQSIFKGSKQTVCVFDKWSIVELP